MSKVTINGKECTAYYGDHKEVTVYNGSTKLYGAESQTKTGSTVVFDDTYNGNGVESLTLTGSNMEGATNGEICIKTDDGNLDFTSDGCTSSFDESTHTWTFSIPTEQTAQQILQSKATCVHFYDNGDSTGGRIMYKGSDLGNIPVKYYTDFEALTSGDYYFEIIGISNGSRPSDATNKNRYIANYYDKTTSATASTETAIGDDCLTDSIDGYKYLVRACVHSESSRQGNDMRYYYPQFGIYEPTLTGLTYPRTWTWENPFFTIVKVPYSVYSEFTYVSTGHWGFLARSCAETFITDYLKGTLGMTLQYEPFTGGLPAPNQYYPLTESVSLNTTTENCFFGGTYNRSDTTWDADTHTLTVEAPSSSSIYSWSTVRYYSGTDTDVYHYKDIAIPCYSNVTEWWDADDKYIMFAGWTGRKGSSYSVNMRLRIYRSQGETTGTRYYDWVQSEANITNYAPVIDGYSYSVRPVCLNNSSNSEGATRLTSSSIGIYGAYPNTYWVENPVLKLVKVDDTLADYLSEVCDHTKIGNHVFGQSKDIQEYIMLYLRDNMGVNIQYEDYYNGTYSTSAVTLDAPHKKADFVTGKIVDGGSTTGSASVDNIGFDVTYDYTYSGGLATHWKAEYNEDTREAVVSVTYDQDMPTTGCYTNVNVCETKFPFADGTYNANALYSGTQTTKKSHVPAYFIHTNKWATSDKKALWVFAFKTGTGVRPSFAGGYGNQCTFRTYNQDKTSVKTVGGSRVQRGEYAHDNGYTYYLLANSYTDSALTTLDWYYLGEFCWQIYDYPYVTSVARTAGTYYWKMTEPFMTIIPISDMSETTQAMLGTPDQYGNPNLNSGYSWAGFWDSLETDGLLPTYEPFTGGLPAPNEYYNSDGTEHDSNYDVGEYPNYYDLVDTHIKQYKTNGTGLTWTVDGTSVSSGTTVTTSENPYSITVNNSTGSAVDAFFDVLSSGFDMYMPSYAEFFAMTDKQPYFLIGFDDASSVSSVTGNMRIEAFSGFNSGSSSIFGTTLTYSVFTGLPTYKGRKYICCPMFKMLRAVDDTTDVIKLRLVATSVPTDTTLYVEGITISIIYLDAMTVSELTPYFNNVSSSITAQCQPTASYNTFFNTYVAPHIAGIDKLDQTYYPSVTITGGDPSKTIKVSDTSDD